MLAIIYILTYKFIGLGVDGRTLLEKVRNRFYKRNCTDLTLDGYYWRPIVNAALYLGIPVVVEFLKLIYYLCTEKINYEIILHGFLFYQITHTSQVVKDLLSRFHSIPNQIFKTTCWSHRLKKYKNVKLIWWCHLFLSGFLTKGHLNLVSAMFVE